VTDEQALTLASRLEVNYPVEFKEASRMIYEGETGLTLLRYIRQVTNLDMIAAGQIRMALIQVQGAL